MATDAPVTVYNALNEIYPQESVLHQGERWNDLATRFEQEFHQKPGHIVRAPGRINLIGEHVDYCLFGVMPAAVEMDCLIALSPAGPPSSKTLTPGQGRGQPACTVTITNLDPSWPGATLNAYSRDDKGNGRWEVQGGSGRRGDWVAYLGSALDCVLNKYFTSPDQIPASLNLMITGSIPPGSGLSSSAALIVVGLLAILLGNGVILDHQENKGQEAVKTRVTNVDLVQMAREAEANIGVNSGGMDQSASVLSRVGAGLYVSFVPELGVEMVQLPSIRHNTGGGNGEEEKLVMVIANSLTKHDLAGGATKQYNLRVMETLIGARVLGRALGVIQDDEQGGDDGVEKLQLRQIVGRFAGEKKDQKETLTPDELEKALLDILPAVEEHLGSTSEFRTQGHLPEQLADLCGLSGERFERVFLDTIEVDTSDQGGRFAIYKRVRHVFEEALRVLQVVRICRGGVGSTPDKKDHSESKSGDGTNSNSKIGFGHAMKRRVVETDVQIVGRLMNESHASCRDLYECSNDELDELVQVCRSAGSVGSRLSGAGWGGCVVSLIPASLEKDFIARITDDREGYSAYRNLGVEELKTVVFKTVPGSGAGATPTSSLLSALLSVRATPPRIIQSPPTQPRRASVALILRLKPPEGLKIPEEEWGVGLELDEFFKLPWVSHPETKPQIMFIRRTSRPSDRYSSHIAFPGGRSEPSDTSSHYTALRETWEEIGVDLAEKEFASVGRLDDREITTSLGKRLLMILSPFVFLQLSPYSPTPDLQPSEISSLHWIDLDRLTPPFDKSSWGHVEIDISSRLSPRNRLVRVLLRGLVGGMKFTSLLLPDEPDCVSPEYLPEFDDLRREGHGTVLSKNGQRRLRLWGLTLGMTLDLLSHLPRPDTTPLVRPRSVSGETSEKTPLLYSTTHEVSAESVLKAPKTPVTVTSSFDDVFAEGGNRSQHRRTKNDGSETGGLAGGTVGSRVDLKVLAGEVMEKTDVGMRENVGNRRGVGPGITAVFPRFSYPDVNMFIWLFSRKYRTLLRQWEASTHGPPSAASRRVNWSGAALSAFYSAVRHALVVAIVVRALATTAALGTAGWYLWKWSQAAR